MKVTLEKFLEITGKSFLEGWACEIYIDKYDKTFEEYFPQMEISRLKDITQLEPFMKYEIYKFNQELEWGEITKQKIYLRKATRRRTKK